MTYPRPPLEQRVFGRVIVEPSGCWLWQGHLNRGGYGMVVSGGSRVYVHRAAYQLRVGQIPDGMQVDHLCKVRNCVNPAHLEPVTPTENNLRSDSWGGKNSRKTSCPKGHPYDSANTYVHNGGRHCRTCSRSRSLAYYHRKRRAAA